MDQQRSHRNVSEREMTPNTTDQNVPTVSAQEIDRKPTHVEFPFA
jgi:hypothetical protein